MKFINRHSEIKTLRTEYERHGSSFVVVYGRRRQGKTTLLKEFAKEYTTLFITLGMRYVKPSTTLVC